MQLSPCPDFPRQLLPCCARSRPRTFSCPSARLSQSMHPILSLKAALRLASRLSWRRLRGSGRGLIWGRRGSHCACRLLHAAAGRLCAHSLSHWGADRRAALWWEAVCRSAFSPIRLSRFPGAAPADGAAVLATQLQQATTLLPSGARVHLAWATRILSRADGYIIAPAPGGLLTGAWRVAVCFGA